MKKLLMKQRIKYKIRNYKIYNKLYNFRNNKFQILKNKLMNSNKLIKIYYNNYKVNE